MWNSILFLIFSLYLLIIFLPWYTTPHPPLIHTFVIRHTFQLYHSFSLLYSSYLQINPIPHSSAESAPFSAIHFILPLPLTLVSLSIHSLSLQFLIHNTLYSPLLSPLYIHSAFLSYNFDSSFFHFSISHNFFLCSLQPVSFFLSNTHLPYVHKLYVHVTLYPPV